MELEVQAMFDIINDPGLMEKGAALAARMGFDLVKVAEDAIPVDKTNATAFPDEEFAFKVKSPKTGQKHRDLPMSDESNTLISTVAFLLKGDQLPEEVRKRTALRLAKRLNDLGHADHAKALAAYGAGAPEKDIEDADSFPKPKPAPKEPKAKFRLKGQEIPINTKEDIEAVASDVDGDLHLLSPIDRRAAALQLFAMGGNLPERLAPYAGLQKNASLSDHLDDRYRMVAEANRPLAFERIQAILAEDDLEARVAKLAEFDAQLGPFTRIPDAVLSVVAQRKVEQAPQKREYPEEIMPKVAMLLGDDVPGMLRDGKEADLGDDAMAIVERLIREMG